MTTTRQRVHELIDAGMSVREIARALGVSTQAVYKHLKVLDIPPPTKQDDESDEAVA